MWQPSGLAVLQAEATASGATFEQTRERMVALLRKRMRERCFLQLQQVEAAKAIISFLQSRKKNTTNNNNNNSSSSSSSSDTSRQQRTAAVAATAEP